MTAVSLLLIKADVESKNSQPSAQEVDSCKRVRAGKYTPLLAELVLTHVCPCRDD